jgi:hypothetical protein
MDSTEESTAASTPAVPTKPEAPPEQRLEEVVRRVKMELISGRSAKFERGPGFNPYDTGSLRDIWGRRRRA